MDRFFGLLTLFSLNSLKNQFRHHLISLFFILRTHFSFKRIEAFVAEIMHHFGLKSFHIVVMIFLLLLLNCIFQKLVVIKIVVDLPVSVVIITVDLNACRLA